MNEKGRINGHGRKGIRIDYDGYIIDHGTYLYKVSNAIKALQYVGEKGIIRVWHEKMLDDGLIEEIENSRDANDLCNASFLLGIE